MRSACRVMSIKTNTFGKNQLISATPEEECRRYQALADGPPWSLCQGL